MRIEVDLKNSNYKIITNEGAKCGFCNKDLKPIGFDYLYVNYDKSMIEYERCNCEKAVQFWKEFDLEQEEKQKVNGKTGTLGPSEQETPINQTETKTATTLNITKTYWSKKIENSSEFKNKIYFSLFFTTTSFTFNIL